MDKYRKLLNKIEELRTENEDMIKANGGVGLDSYEAGYNAALYAVEKEAERIEITEKKLIDYEKSDWVRKNRLWLIQNGWIEKERLVWAIEKQMAMKKKKEAKEAEKKAAEIKVDMIPCEPADEKVCEAIIKLLNM